MPIDFSIFSVCLSGSGPTLEQMEDALKNYEGMLDRKKSFGKGKYF